MALSAAVRARIQATLKRHRPASVKVFRVDSDEEMVITPTGNRGRWERVVQSVPQNAERIEMLDAKGGTIFALDVEQPEAAPAEGTGPLSQTALLGLLLKAQEMALDRQTAAMKGITDAYERLAKMLAERLTSLERGYSQVLSAAFESTVMAAEAQAKLNIEEDKGESNNVLDAMAGELMQKLVTGKDKVVQKKLDTTAKPAQPVVQKG